MDSLITLILWILVLVCPVAVFWFLLKRSKLGFSGLLVMYLTGYLILSAGGSYVEANQGGSDNRATWFPAKCGGPYTAPSGRQKSELNFLGGLFWPLVLLDRSLVHPTKLIPHSE